jgi:RNA polymerase sigma-70 factor (ECF subfamily)
MSRIKVKISSSFSGITRGIHLAHSRGPVENAAGDVTQLLHQLKQGNRDAEEKLITIVYNSLRKLAANQLRREGAAHSLQPTALVHEAYLRIGGLKDIDWQSRSHFFRISARMIRRILVDRARAHRAAKRGEGLAFVSFDEATALSPQRPADVIALDDAMQELAKFDPRAAQIIEMNFFAGITQEEIAALLGIDVRTVKRDWKAARLWLRDEVARILKREPTQQES